jgi:hypothetical protein
MLGKGSGSGPTMKLRPAEVRGTLTVSLTGLPPLMVLSSPVNTRETAKRKPRPEDGVEDRDAAYSEEGRA